MNCELWVKGLAWTGSADVEIDVLWRSNFFGAALPIITYSRPGGNGTTIYHDGFGGEFSGTGWYGSPVYYVKGDCSALSPTQPYDCINGGCVPKTTYNTPGVYASLAACESGCAKNSNCTGECVSTDEIAALQQAASALQARLCK